MTIDPVWAGTLGALGGVTLSGVFGLLTAKMTRGWNSADQRTTRREERRALMAELRREAYVDFLVAWDQLEDRALLWRRGVEDQARDFSEEQHLALLYRFNQDLRAEIETLDASRRRAELLADREVRDGLRSLPPLQATWTLRLAGGEDPAEVTREVNEHVKSLSPLMEAELRSLDQEDE